MSAIPLAGIFGNPFSGWITDKFASAAGLRGWQWMFLNETVPAVLCGAVVTLVLDNNIASGKWLTEVEKKMLRGEIEADLTQHNTASVPISAVMRDGRVWFLAFIYFAFIVGQCGLTLWMPTLIHGTGVRNTANVGWLSAIPFVCAVIAMNLLCRSAHKHRERRWHLMVPALVGAAGFCVAASFSHSTVVSVVAPSLAAAGVLTCAPPFWALPTAFMAGTAAAVGVAIINSIGNLAGFVSPSLIGLLRDLTHSSASGMYFLEPAP